MNSTIDYYPSASMYLVLLSAVSVDFYICYRLIYTSCLANWAITVFDFIALIELQGTVTYTIGGLGAVN